MRYAAVFGLLLLLAFAFGCVNEGKSVIAGMAGDDYSQYVSLLKKAENLKEFKVKYKFYDLDNDEWSDDTFFLYAVKGDKKKMVFSTYFLGSEEYIAGYSVNDKVVVCSSIIWESCSLVDSIENESQSIGRGEHAVEPNIPEKDKVEVKYLGEETIADRIAKCFEVTYEPGYYYEFMNSTDDELKDREVTETVCLDEKTGFTLKVVVKYNKYSEIMNEYEPTLDFGLKAVYFNENVEDKEFEIPENFGIKLYCNDNGDGAIIQVTAFNPLSGSMKVNATDWWYDDELIAEKTYSVDLGEFESRNYTFKFSQPYDDSYTINVCIGGSCSSDTCW